MAPQSWRRRLRVARAAERAAFLGPRRRERRREGGEGVIKAEKERIKAEKAEAAKAQQKLRQETNKQAKKNKGASPTKVSELSVQVLPEDAQGGAEPSPSETTSTDPTEGDEEDTTTTAPTATTAATAATAATRTTTTTTTGRGDGGIAARFAPAPEPSGVRRPSRRRRPSGAAAERRRRQPSRAARRA